MDGPRCMDDRLKIDIRHAFRGQTVIEGRSRLSPGFTDLIGLQRALDDISDRSIFTSGKTMCEVACSGTTDGQLRFSQEDLLLSGR